MTILNTLKSAVLIMAGGFLVACGSEDSSSSSSNGSDSPSTSAFSMCTQRSGNTLSVECTSSSCSSGYSFHSSYSSSGSCVSRRDTILDHFSNTGEILSGTSGTGGSSGGGSGGGSTGGSGGVSLSNISACGTSIQVPSLCTSTASTLFNAICSGSSSSSLLRSACQSYIRCLGQSISDPAARATYEAATQGTCDQIQ